MSKFGDTLEQAMLDYINKSIEATNITRAKLVEQYSSSSFDYSAQYPQQAGASEIVSYRDDMVYEGYCDTCAYEYMEVTIEYIDDEGAQQSFTYSGTLGEFITELTL